DVIEHLKDPKAALKELRRVLKNDGILYLSTPDIESFLSRVLRAKWWGINKFHLFYFSKKTLEQLFHEVGFKSLCFMPYPRIFSLGYWTKRLEPYPFFVRWPFQFAAGLGGLRGVLLKVVLHDQIDVIARKLQRLDTVREEDVALPEVTASKLKVMAILPAYNAAKTLERTVQDIPKDAVDEIILVDDASRDETVAIARRLKLTVFRHAQNRGYGANQKTCYEKAIERGAGIVVMVHPDYQYDPRMIPQLIEPIRRGEADAVFGSRMMKGGALEGGMPLWKHNANILLTAFENVVLGTYLTEYHSGFRAYSAEALQRIRYRDNSDGFVFDTEIIVQLVANRMKIDEIPIRTRYFEEASSIKLWPSILYGLGILRVMLRTWLHSKGIFRDKKLFPASPSRSA
ncbi:MAG: glycosyltransferase, partial [Candidatus Omnitrophica bacterium]|nr:glycosyltransferase [Candidatus Omnitrophota bacterium]